jgi:hypothetical protein
LAKAAAFCSSISSGAESMGYFALLLWGPQLMRHCYLDNLPNVPLLDAAALAAEPTQDAPWAEVISLLAPHKGL